MSQAPDRPLARGLARAAAALRSRPRDIHHPPRAARPLAGEPQAALRPPLLGLPRHDVRVARRRSLPGRAARAPRWPPYLTWGSTLTLHPRIHCLVTGGGRAPDGSWRAARGGFLLPVRVVRLVRALFRGKLLAWFRSDLENDRLLLPDGVSKAELERSLRRLYPKTWNVRLQQRYASSATPTATASSRTWPATSGAARSGIAGS